MESSEKKTITVEVLVNVPREIVWKLWNTPEDIMQWNHASDDWHTSFAQADVRPGGKFHFRMEAKDGSTGFDFDGVYKKVQPWGFISYTLRDGRKVQVTFTRHDAGAKITETFDAENQHAIDIQRTDWQAILHNFKKYAESNSGTS